MEKTSVNIVNKGSCDYPTYETDGAAGMDIRANLIESITINPLERKLVSTGLYVEMPLGMECQVRPRSGLALKKGLTVLNSPGTIDSDYRGEIGVILINLSSEVVEITPNERIAQLVFASVVQVGFEIKTELSASERGAGGFGSTGLK
jgi:dUTP pyrophosphatase